MKELLDVWQKAVELYPLVHEVMMKAKIEYKLRAQIEDSTQSVSSNIAEGYSCRSIKEYIQHLYVSLGSLSETLSRAITFTAAGQISGQDFERIDILHYEVENKLWSLVGSLQKMQDEGTWSDRVFEEMAEYNADDESNNPPIQ